MSFPSLISKKPGEIRIFRTFSAKFLILAYISLKIGYFELGHDYDATVMSYLGCRYLFWYVWKEKNVIEIKPAHTLNHYNFKNTVDRPTYVIGFTYRLH